MTSWGACLIAGMLPAMPFNPADLVFQRRMHRYSDSRTCWYSPVTLAVSPAASLAVSPAFLGAPARRHDPGFEPSLVLGAT